MKANGFAQADRISERITDILNDELKQPDFSPVQAFAGQLLALIGFASTAPLGAPRPFEQVLEAAHECLASILSAAARPVARTAPAVEPNKKGEGL